MRRLTFTELPQVEDIESAQRILQRNAWKTGYCADHLHPFGIWLAWHYFDAAEKTKLKISRVDLERTVSDWAGRSVTSDDLIVAAFLHPEVVGNYPVINVKPQRVPKLPREVKADYSLLIPADQRHLVKAIWQKQAERT